MSDISRRDVLRRLALTLTATVREVKRYVLPSSCSIYGFQDKDVVVDETWPTNPLTTYAIANEKAEHDVLAAHHLRASIDRSGTGVRSGETPVRHR